MRRFLRENGLSVAMFGLFLLSFSGQIGAGFNEYNQDQRDHRQPEAVMTEYLSSGHFIEAVFENWESEFLQMALYVLLTIHLRQKGSSESKKLDEPEEVDRDPSQSKDNPDAPWPVRQGGWILALYKNSLGLAMLLLFVMSFALHAVGGAMAYNQDQAEHGQATVSILQYVESSRFWFESFQNWQSEFLSIGMIVVLSIYLRQQGSPESKPVDAPHEQTGNS